MTRRLTLGYREATAVSVDAVARRRRAACAATSSTTRRSSRWTAATHGRVDARRARHRAQRGLRRRRRAGELPARALGGLPADREPARGGCAGGRVSAPPLVVVGIGADGWAGLGEAARAAVLAAEVIVGSQRQLALVPESRRASGGPWPSPIDALLDELCATATARGRACSRAATRCCTASARRSRAASGPGACRCIRIPRRSRSRARGWAGPRPRSSWSARSGGRRRCSPARCSRAGGSSPTPPGAAGASELARVLCERGFGPSRMVVLEQLGGPAERLVESTAERVGRAPGRRAARRRARVPRGGRGGLAAAHRRAARRRLRARRPDHEARDPRASRWPRSRPRRDSCCGTSAPAADRSAIEWLRAEPSARAIAIEARAERAQRAARERAGARRAAARRARGPGARRRSPAWTAPDAVFVGGGLTEPGLLEPAGTRCARAAGSSRTP